MHTISTLALRRCAVSSPPGHTVLPLYSCCCLVGRSSHGSAWESQSIVSQGSAPVAFIPLPPARRQASLKATDARRFYKLMVQHRQWPVHSSPAAPLQGLLGVHGHEAHLISASPYPSNMALASYLLSIASTNNRRLLCALLSVNHRSHIGVWREVPITFPAEVLQTTATVYIGSTANSEGGSRACSRAKVDCALALVWQGRPVKTVCRALGLARSNVREKAEKMYWSAWMPICARFF
jgi:hypothetical protein